MPKGKKCIIYGGGGFIGSHLCDELLRKEFEVTIFDKLNFDRINIAHNKSKINLIEGDFNNSVNLQESLKNIDVVFHLVSSTLPASSNENPVYDVETNLISTLKLLKLCREYKIKKIVFISSGGTVYGIPDYIPIKENHPRRPICSYGIVKKTIEDYLFMYNKIHNLDYYVFRLSNPYGERQNPYVTQGVIAVFLNKILKNEIIDIWGDGEVKRDFIYIKDAVELIVKSLNISASDKIFNLSSSIGYTINDLLRIVEKVTSINSRVKYSNRRDIDVPVSILDNTLVKKTFSWEPSTKIEDGIKSSYEYLSKILQ